jgi:hypothetical protein
MIYRSSPLERSLTNLFYSLYKYQTAPANPLYAHLPMTITVPLADMAVSMVLSPKSGESDESWAHWGEMDEDASDTSSELSGDWIGGMMDVMSGNKGSEIRVEPWQTLLLLEEDAAEKAGEMANALVGLGLGFQSSQGEESRTVSPVAEFNTSRRGSKDTSAEEDEKALMQALIQACDVSKPCVPE